jgi:hypothetical protein
LQVVSALAEKENASDKALETFAGESFGLRLYVKIPRTDHKPSPPILVNFFARDRH